MNERTRVLDGELEAPNRLDNLEALTRASHAVLAEQAANPSTALQAHSSMFEIVTAQRVMVPRDLGAFIQRIKTLAAVTGEGYYYSIPVRKKNKETGAFEAADPIEGPTIQLAQDLAREYGNCGVDTRVVDIGDRWVIYARFTDYERGFSQVRPYLQRKNQESIGGTDKGRQQDAAFQIGVSKAVRNVIVKSLDSFADMMFEAAKAGLVKAVGAKLPFYKEKIAARLRELNVALSRVEPLVGRPIKDWDAHETTRLVVQLKSISEGMATPEELWPDPKTFIDPNDKGGGHSEKPKTEDSASSSEPNAGAVQTASTVDGTKPVNGPGVAVGGAGRGAGVSAGDGDAAAPGGAPVQAGEGGNGKAGPAVQQGQHGAAGSEHGTVQGQGEGAGLHQPSDPGGQASGDGDPKPQAAQPLAPAAQAESENPFPPAEEISEQLGRAFTELLAMHAPEQIQVLDEQAKQHLSEQDYARFEGARDERLAAVLAKPKPAPKVPAKKR